MAHAQKRTRGGKVRWVARWSDGDGRERSRTFDTRREAAQHAHRMEAAERDRPDIAQARRTMTVEAWLDRWLDDYIAPRVAAGQRAPKTAVGYESNVRVHLVPQLGHLLLSELLVDDVDRMLTRIIASGRSPGTARSIRATLSTALTAAGRAGLVDRNAAQLAEPPPLPNPDPSSFTAAEVARIFAAAPAHRLGSAIAICLLCNLRASACVGLSWDDLDLDAATFRVSTTTHRVPQVAARVLPETGLVDSPRAKTDASGRPRRLPPLAVQILREQRAAQAQERLAADVWHDSGRAWTTTIGTRLDTDALRDAHYEILDAAGVPATSTSGKGRALHELRRTWAERTRRAGIPVEDAARAGGWSTHATMQRHYSATPDDRLDRASGAVADGLAWGDG